MDLAVISAILSSNENVPVNPEFCFAGEVGLTGEIRPVTRIEQRITEAEKLGFKTIFVSKFNTKGLNLGKANIKVIGINKVEELYKYLFY
jgi:DNA repair protein RadA/Sms